MNQTQTFSHYQYDKEGPNGEIGRGQFGIVYKCTDLNDPSLDLCVKVIQTIGLDEKMMRELEIMKQLIEVLKIQYNPNIIQVFCVHADENQIYIVLERCDKDLSQEMEEKTVFPVEEAIDIIKQIVSGYHKLYKMDIIHRDLKPANILKKGNDYKISDLGMARVIDRNQKNLLLTKVGTPAYAAPQLFFDPTFTDSADIFSVGLIFYQLIFGKLPFTCQNQIQLKRALKNLQNEPIKIQVDPENNITQPIATLIESMLKYSEKDRITWSEMFKHPVLFGKIDGAQNIMKSVFFAQEQKEQKEQEKQQQPEGQSPVEHQKQKKQIIRFTTNVQPIQQNGTPPPSQQFGQSQQGVTAIKKIQTIPVQHQSDYLVQLAAYLQQIALQITQFMNTLQLLNDRELYQLKGYILNLAESFTEHSLYQKSQQPNLAYKFNIQSVNQTKSKIQMDSKELQLQVQSYRIQIKLDTKIDAQFYNLYYSPCVEIIQNLLKRFQIKEGVDYFENYIQLLYKLGKLKDSNKYFQSEDIKSLVLEAEKDSKQMKSFMTQYLMNQK